MPTYYTFIDSPLEQLLLISDGRALIGLYMSEQRHGPKIGVDWQQDDLIDPFKLAEAQLAAYFSRQLQEFSIPFAPHGTVFQKTVWQALQSIPYGTTTTYGDLARQIGHPTSVRAVGQANARNPLSIIIPCHRVISSKGKLTGYGGGLERKAALLALEGVMLFSTQSQQPG